jgi:hypothetical protein
MTGPLKPSEAGAFVPQVNEGGTSQPVVRSGLTQDQQAYLLKVYTESFANPTQFKAEIENFKKALQTADLSATNSKGNNFKGDRAFEFKRLLATRANEIGRSNDANALNVFATKLASKDGNPTGINFGIAAVQVALTPSKSTTPEVASPDMAPLKPVNPADVAMKALVSSLPNLITASKNNGATEKLQEFYGNLKTFIEGVESDKAFSEAFNAAQAKAGSESIELLLKSKSIGQVVEAVHAFVQTEEGKKFTEIAQKLTSVATTYEALGTVPVK